MDDRWPLQERDGNDFSAEGQEPQAFTAVPQPFLAKLSPEQFRAMQQMYETAFEMARQKMARENAEADWTDERWLGDGI